MTIIKDIEFTYSRQPPQHWTFLMPDVKKWVEEHATGKVLNLFAGKIRLNLDEYRVDISDEFHPDLVMEAEKAMRKFIGEGRFFDTVILDPPYSLRMSREKYGIHNHIGKFAKILNLTPRVLNENGVVITLGYKTGEMSPSRGFALRSIMVIEMIGGSENIFASQEVSIESDYYLNGRGSRWVNGDGVDEFEEDE